MKWAHGAVFLLVPLLQRQAETTSNRFDSFISDLEVVPFIWSLRLSVLLQARGAWGASTTHVSKFCKCWRTKKRDIDITKLPQIYHKQLPLVKTSTCIRPCAPLQECLPHPLPGDEGGSARQGPGADVSPVSLSARNGMRLGKGPLFSLKSTNPKGVPVFSPMEIHWASELEKRRHPLRRSSSRAAQLELIQRRKLQTDQFATRFFRLPRVPEMKPTIHTSSCLGVHTCLDPLIKLSRSGLTDLVRFGSRHVWFVG